MIPDKSEEKIHKAFNALPHSERVEIIREIALRGYQDAIDLAACRALIGTYPRSYFRDPMTVRAARQVLKSLIDRILITSESALAFRRRIDDRNARVAMFLLNDKGIYSDIAATGNSQSLEIARQAWAAADLDPRRDWIKHYRNKFVAHRTKSDPDQRDPFVDEIHTIAGRVGFMLAHLATGVGIPADSSELNSDTNHLSAYAFWKPWTANKSS